MIENEIRSLYQVPEKNLPQLAREIEKLNRRAVRIGVAPVTFIRTGKIEAVEIKRDGEIVEVRNIVEISLIGQAPKFAGWTLAATLEHTPEGNIIRKVPSIEINLMPFKQSKPVCEHCRLIRNRRDTYLVAHDDGSVKQVGHDCIADFLGHKDPHALAALAELMFSAGELCGIAEEGFEGGGSGGSDNMIYVETLLAYTARAIRQLGFVSGKAEREAELSGGSRQSTRNTALGWMFPPPKGSPSYAKVQEKFCTEDEVWPRPTDEDRAMAVKAREFVLSALGAKQNLTEFENNLLICAKLQAIELRTAGIACYIVEYLRRETEKAKEQAARPNLHFGEVKKRYRDVALTYLGCSSFDSAYGTCFINKFETADGAKLVWKTSTGMNLDDGTKLVATFTVKEHSDYKGWKQTKISRVTYEKSNQSGV